MGEKGHWWDLSPAERMGENWTDAFSFFICVYSGNDSRVRIIMIVEFFWAEINVIKHLTSYYSNS